jgi:diguanylate cyclase (GGDEF)-like protein
VVDETRENAAGYLKRAEDSVVLATGVIESGLFPIDEPARLDRYFLQQLRVIPQIDAIFFGNGQGQFVFSKKQQGGDAFVSKLILPNEPAGERVRLIERNRALIEQRNRFDPDDRYDPRSRPWYSLALASQASVWTDPYIFYTSQQPGLTVARAVRDADGKVLGVVGADVELSAISDFLKTQRVGSSGAAFVIYGNGDVLAHPGSSNLVETDADGQLRLLKLADVDPVAAYAGERLHVKFNDIAKLDEAHYDRFELGKERYLAMFVPLIAHGSKPWLMGVYAPEDELARKIREGQRESIVLGVAVSMLVVTAAIMVGMVLLRPIYTLQRQAQEDPLTGLLNRRSFDGMAERRLRNAARNRQEASALMIDIDGFKPINDSHGHAIGDEVLRAVSNRLAAGISTLDLVGRYGGEEFAVLLPGTGLARARLVAERLRRHIEDEPIMTSVGALSVTVSIGVAEQERHDEPLDSIVHRADLGLLEAKRSGRNRVATVV